MPSNLNALIRYKTINSCLFGGYRRWSIKELVEACSSALAEARGRYEKISERTLRDDIRVMRSDILGFNAPITQQGGLYFYSDPHYSILSVSITDSGLVNKIIRLLLEIRPDVKHPEFEIILERLLLLTGESISKELSAEGAGLLKEKDITAIETPEYSRDLKSIILPQPEKGKKISKIKQLEEKSFEIPEDIQSLISFSPAPSATVTWGDVLGLFR